jgi:uncharacterized protein YukE
MSEQIEAPVGAPDTEAAALAAANALLGTMVGEPPPAPAAETPAPAPAEAPAPAPEPAKEPPLSEVIRQARVERQQRAVKDRENADLRTKLQEATERLSRLDKADMVADPIGFAQAHGISEQEMALIGQAYLYHLVPDKAPPDLRYKLLEAKTARTERQREAERAEAAKKAAADAEAQSIQQYAGVLGASVQVWEGSGQHPFPASQAWFGGSQNEYAESLMHTARNLAEAARVAGEVADLSPKAVAEALERELAPRVTRIRGTGSRLSQTSEKAPAQPAAGGKQPAVLSTRGQGGQPVPEATTEEERIRRATEAAFGGRK